MKKTLTTFFIVTVALIAQVKAQTEIAPEKKAAIKELTTLISVNNDVNQLVKILSAQSDIMEDRIVDSVLNDRTDLSEAEKKFVKETIIGQKKDYSDRFREKFFQKLNITELIDEISIMVYDKYYTLDEIKDLLAFYKTPTGQKMLKNMSPVMTETVQLTQERLLPKLESVIKEMEQEEKAELEKQINARKPRTKKPNSK